MSLLPQLPPVPVPLELALPPLLLAAQIALYALAAPRLRTEKQRAYVLSVTCSALMTAMSVPFVVSYARYGLVATFERAQVQEGREEGAWMWMLSRVAVVGFGTYLFADVSVGV